MKKNTVKGQKQKWTSRLSLKRETILVLNDPALLEIARAGLNNGTLNPGGCVLHSDTTRTDCD